MSIVHDSVPEREMAGALQAAVLLESVGTGRQLGRRDERLAGAQPHRSRELRRGRLMSCCALVRARHRKRVKPGVSVGFRDAAGPRRSWQANARTRDGEASVTFSQRRTLDANRQLFVL